jgi:hypothetical protein
MEVSVDVHPWTLEVATPPRDAPVGSRVAAIQRVKRLPLVADDERPPARSRVVWRGAVTRPAIVFDSAVGGRSRRLSGCVRSP